MLVAVYFAQFAARFQRKALFAFQFAGTYGKPSERVRHDVSLRPPGQQVRSTDLFVSCTTVLPSRLSLNKAREPLLSGACFCRSPQKPFRSRRCLRVTSRQLSWANVVGAVC